MQTYFYVSSNNLNPTRVKILLRDIIRRYLDIILDSAGSEGCMLTCLLMALG